MISPRNDHTHTCDGSNSRGGVCGTDLGWTNESFAYGFGVVRGRRKSKMCGSRNVGERSQEAKIRTQLSQSDPLCTHTRWCHPTEIKSLIYLANSEQIMESELYILGSLELD